MQIYTSYFHTIPKLRNAGILPVIISMSSPPEMQDICSFSKLAPSRTLVGLYKSGGLTDRTYIELYSAQVLSRWASTDALYTELSNLTEGQDCALLCWEKPGTFCHRHLVADFLTAGGYPVSEWGYARQTGNITEVLMRVGHE
jgi:hypothetical protein